MAGFLLLFQKKLFPSSDQWRFWIGISIVIKASLFLLQVSQQRAEYLDGFMGHITGDADSYLDPIDNLIENGEYDPDYRLPGYGIVYLPLRLLFNKALACNILITLQMVVAAVSVYFLALTAKQSFRTDAMFYGVFYAFCLSSYSNLFDSYILSDSFCTSAMIFSVYFFTRYMDEGKKRQAFLAGLFLTWSFFLRPMFAPLLLFFLLFLLVDAIQRKTRFTALARITFFFLIPFLILETAWVTRNYLKYDKLLPLTTSLYARDFEASYIRELMDFVKSWGGDGTWWSAGSEMRWFGAGGHLSFEGEQILIPDYIYTSAFSKDSLLMIREYVRHITIDDTSADDRDRYTALAKEKLNRFTVSVKDEKPFLFYVKGPLILFKRFFIHSGTYNLFHKTYKNLNPLEWLVKLFYSAFYVAVLVLGSVGIILAFIRRRSERSVMLIVGIALYSAALFPFVLKLIEYRYFLPAFPFLLIMAVYSAVSLYNAVMNKLKKQQA